ncbi:MAG: CAF17-like 4Fe-4S cluster assembly/insertion protein YgfZ [Sulfuricaulis sp.]
MNETWKTFIVNQGAVLEGGRVVHFGHPVPERRAAAEGNVLADLSELALIRAHGADAQSFLNGQLSNDIRLVDATHSQLAAWCNPKGRMLAIFRVCQRGDDYLLQLPAALQDSMLKRLRMFVMRAKLTLESAESDLISIGISGAQAEKNLRAAAGFVPQGENLCATRDGMTIMRLPGPLSRFQIIAPVDPAMKLWSDLKTGATPVGPPAWAWLDIMAGIPAVLPENSEAFVPQMVNLELVGGVHFKKGCYPGQEIVARMQYLGKLKQRMYRAHANDEIVRPGEAIFAPDLPGQSVGAVIDAQTAPDGGYDLLAVVQISSAAGGVLHLRSENGPALTLLTLPYSFPIAASG